MSEPGAARIDAVVLPDPPDAWERLGFAVAGGAVVLGGVRIVLGGEGPARWTLRGPGWREPEPVAHPNGATGVDHLVVLTDDFDATLERLRAEGYDHRRTREAGGGVRQAFFVLGPCLLELAGPVAGGERLWGLTLVAGDLEPFREHVGRVRDAVQPGRRIATVRRDAGLRTAVAVMTPRA